MQQLDKALELKILTEQENFVSKKQAIIMLNESKIIEKLTCEFPESKLFAIWRILALAEIPYTIELEYTKQLIKYINENIATEYGFSYTGKVDNIVPCYNAMLVEAYCKLGLCNTKEVQIAIEWIKKYQLFDRNLVTEWNKPGIQKHGGCLKSTPCYIGIGKTVKALLWYSKCSNDKSVDKYLDLGINYMKRHSFYKRLSNGKIIYSHITDFSYPSSYLLNIIDIAEIIYYSNIANDEKKEFGEFVKSYKNDEGVYPSNYVYSGQDIFPLMEKPKTANG